MNWGWAPEVLKKEGDDAPQRHPPQPMHNLRPGPASQRLASQRVRLLAEPFQATAKSLIRLPLLNASRSPANRKIQQVSIPEENDAVETEEKRAKIDIFNPLSPGMDRPGIPGPA